MPAPVFASTQVAQAQVGKAPPCFLAKARRGALRLDVNRKLKLKLK
jgi:hypothetical protein